MNELALFCGVGGGVLGGRLLDTQVVCAVEREPYAIEVLLRRQEDGSLPPFPIWDDIKTFEGFPFRGFIDVVSAGFPCQPFSEAGKQEGEDDDRNLWPDTARVIGEVRPRTVLLENVPGLLRSYGGTVLGDLSALGYDCRWGTVSAQDAGAAHLRKRWWCVAHAQVEQPVRVQAERQRRKSACRRGSD